MASLIMKILKEGMFLSGNYTSQELQDALYKRTCRRIDIKFVFNICHFAGAKRLGIMLAVSDFENCSVELIVYVLMVF